MSPIDMLTGAQDAVVKLLLERLPEAEAEIVFATIPQDTPAPFHLIGEIDTERLEKNDQLERISVDVHTVERGNRRDLLARMHLVRLAVDDQVVTVPGAAFQVSWVSAAASTAASDGVTFAGITSLDLFAYPA